MANFNNEHIKDILRHNDIISNNDILEINYTTNTGRGCFRVYMPDRFPTTAHNMKLFIDMFLKAGNPEEAAHGLYEYLKKCSDFLTMLRDRTLTDTDQEKKDRAALTNQIKKYNNNIEALCKVFNFDTVQDPETVKMTKIDTVAVVYENARYTAKNKRGYRFIKAGHVFHVYKEGKTAHVLVPCCGLSIADYDGDIKAAPQYITDHIIKLLNNGYTKLTGAYNRLMSLIAEAENLILNQDIKAPEEVQETTPATPEEKAPAPAAAPEEIETEKEATAAPEEVKEAPAPEVAPDPDIDNAINVFDNEYKYTIIARPHGSYDVIAQCTATFTYLSIIVNAAGAVCHYRSNNRGYCNEKYYNNNNVKMLYGLYEKLQRLGLLPEYTPTNGTRKNIKEIYNRHVTPDHKKPLYYATLYNRLVMDPGRPEAVQNGIKTKKGITDQVIKKGAYMTAYDAHNGAYITPDQITGKTPPGIARNYHGITPGLYNQITAAPPGIWTALKCNKPGFYNTS